MSDSPNKIPEARFPIRFISKEWQRLLLSLLASFTLTVILYSLLNAVWDGQLGKGFEKICEENGCDEIEDTYALLFQVNSPEDIRAFATGDSTLPDGALHSGTIRRLILYGVAETESWRGISSGLLLPYISAPDYSTVEIIEILVSDPVLERRLEKYAAGNRRDYLEFKNAMEETMAGPLEAALDPLKSSVTFRLRRYFNGFIQFLTFLLAITGILHLALFHLISPNGNGIVGKRPDANDPDTLVVSKIYQIQGQTTAHTYLQELVAGKRDDADSEMGMMRYIAWGVPSVGFIGTVLGIGKALENAHTVITGEVGFQTKGAVQSITASLGVAFDTTLIALLLSLLLMLMMHAVTRYEEASIDAWAKDIWSIVSSGQEPAPELDSNRYNHLLQELKNNLREEELGLPQILLTIEYLEDQVRGKEEVDA